jgi:DtxR family Mn-dependent transcriptional regulator
MLTIISATPSPTISWWLHKKETGEDMSALLVFSTITILLSIITVLAFWPRIGLFWQWRRGIASTQRVLIEDALKHLYVQEYNGVKSTLQSVCGSLAITAEQAVKLMTRLQTLGLIESREEGFELTKEGRSYGLRMIRIHRLWERYLADETGLAETEWHSKAEKLEHYMTDQDVDNLAATVGFPVYDPHGDPIPTSTGNLPPKKGQPLTDLATGQHARIIHLEDEPGTIYAQLAAEGLYPGQQIHIVDKSPRRFSFVADGEEIVLAPIVAANITVEHLPKQQLAEVPSHSLASLDIGERGEVLGISTLCRGLQRRRIMDLGVIPGTVISAEMRSPSGDPTGYDIRGAVVALRKSQAELIQIKVLEEVSHDANH